MVAPVTLADLDALLAAAVSALARTSPETSTCTLSKAGVPVPAAKHAEGRWAALREVQRAGRGADDLRPTAQDVASAWTSDLDRLRATGAGPDWIAYRTGGLDALRDLLDGPGAPRTWPERTEQRR